jgi:aminoglycoside phosphotransferase (APT) family kinase protein
VTFKSGIGPDPVDDILGHHGLRGPWEALTATGVVNRIYATPDVVLRIATDHPEAVEDARTESVAAPIARASGVLVPRLLAFDDSRALVDRPYSIWERIHGETLGLWQADPLRQRETWGAVGRQLAVLHSRVRECPDPHGWLDRPDRDMNLAGCLASLASASHIDRATAKDLERWIEALRPAVITATKRCFLHNDVYDMNLMCRRDGSLLAVIDWGDAGWGDPVLELAQIPLAAVPFVMTTYELEAPELLGDRPEAKVIWDKLAYALTASPDDRRLLDELLRFIQTADDRWRRVIR